MGTMTPAETISPVRGDDGNPLPGGDCELPGTLAAGWVLRIGRPCRMWEGREEEDGTSVLGTSYPLLNIFWTMLEVFAFIIWIFILFNIIFDIFRSHDLGGVGKALWFLFVLFLPLIGVLAYLIVRGSSMHVRRAEEAREQQDAFAQYVRETAGGAGGGNTADELSKLADLKAKGVLSESEFESQKAKLLG